MVDLKILHTSDLLAGAPASRGVFDEVIGDLATRLHESIDYLVVSGNLTADASETSFQEAGAILRRMAETLLLQRDGLQLNRVLIVPGPRDRGDGGDFRAFTTFHDQFFENEIGSRRVEQFDPAEVIVRDLKDLTLLGLTYWRGSRGDGAGPCSIATLKDALARAKSRLAGLLYTQQTPTVLVSAGTLLLDPDDSTSFETIRLDFRSSFKTTVHCFGSGDSVVSLPTPTTLQHVGFGTGSRNASGFWPVVFNAIKVTPQAKRDPTLRLLGVETFVRRSERAGLEPMTWLEGELDQFCKRESDVQVSDEDLYAPLLRDLEEKFANNRFVVLDGFPGAGKGAFYEFLKGRDRFVKMRLHVTPVRVDHVGHYRNLGASILAQVAVDPPPRISTFRLLVIHDTCFGRLPNEKKSELKDLFKDETHGLNPRVSAHFNGVLLLRTSSNYTLVADPVIGTLDALTFGPAEASTIEQLVSNYAWVAPVERQQVRWATGDYRGFSQLILKTALREFSSRSGAEPLRNDSSLQLLRTVLHTDPVERELHLHRITMEQMNVDLCRYIEEKVDECVSKESNGSKTSVNPMKTEVIIDVEEITESLRDATKKQGVSSVLKTLAKCGILESVGTETSSRYRVRVLAPFLVGSGWKGNRMTANLKIPWPTITNEDRNGPFDIVILTALPDEREAVLAKLQKKQRLNPHPDDIQIGYYSKVPFTMPEDRATGFYRVVVTDMLSMGEVDAALAAERALRRWKAKIIIVVGIAGGVARNGVALGDVLVASQVAYYGLQSIKDGKPQIRWNAHGCDPGLRMAANHFAIEAMKPYIAEPRPETGEPKMHAGPIASGDIVIKDEAVLAALAEPFPKLIGVEMEGWGVISAAAQAATPTRFFMVRGVSDLADPDKDSPRVADWRAYARDVAAAYAIAFLQSGPLHVKPQQERNG
ncbi:MAG: hypothetical protein WB973_13880 [Thermoanaerobaculia bacterium]